MGAALMLARQALGSVAPNPAVGCVLVKNGIVMLDYAHHLRDHGMPFEEAVANALRYVGLNPVRARLVKRAADWSWSMSTR